jgi:hypothetical protein
MGQAMLKHQKEHSAGVPGRRPLPCPCWMPCPSARWLLGPGAQARQAVAECCSPGSCPHPAAEPEPWRQQLLSTAFAVGCSLLGGAAAVLIISRTQGL